MGRKARREIEYETPAEYRMVERAISVQTDRKLLASSICLLIFLLYNFKLERFIENRNFLGIISIFAFALITCITLVISLIGVHVEMEDVYFITDGVVTHKNKFQANRLKNKGTASLNKYVYYNNGRRNKKVNAKNYLGYKMAKGDKVRLVWCKSLSDPIVIPDTR
jgi:TM2 domain-containing membrane protein YozV